MGKAAWAGSQEASNEKALMSQHLSHWWVNSRSAQEEPELGMQGAQEEPRPNREAGNHLSAGAGLDPKCSQGPVFAHRTGTPPSLLLPHPALVILQGLCPECSTSPNLAPPLSPPLSLPSSLDGWNSVQLTSHLCALCLFPPVSKVDGH